MGELHVEQLTREDITAGDPGRCRSRSRSGNRVLGRYRQGHQANENRESALSHEVCSCQPGSEFRYYRMARIGAPPPK